ncbi:MAG TPA: arsenate reductase [Woeseiaceae bacterium]|nr:arsenate reductase [Woeseiaceae bacterium]
MTMLTIYGIGSCNTCREARKWLDAEGIAYRFHDLREDGLDIQTLERWADAIEWEKLLNKSSLTWRKLPEVDRGSMTRNRALAAMIEHPTLVKRPVLERGKLVAVGFSARHYEGLLKKP